MAFLAVLLLVVGGLLVYAGRTGRRPLDVLRAMLRGEPMPEPAHVIGDVFPNSGGGGGGGGELPTGSVTFTRPLPGWNITSPYGMRWGRMHLGVDVPAATGTPIRAAASGIVDAAGWAAGAGNRVNVKHTKEWETRYFHMSRIAVRKGERVQQGQTIGYVGSTGDSSGPHLHFEILRNGNHVNPAGYVR